MSISSLINDRRVQEFFSYRILSRQKISSWLFTNCAVTSNICFKVRLSWFLTTLWKIEKFFPMNVAAFNIVAINILHIIECSSHDSAMLDILFCLFRTWSLTLFTNSAASLPMIKFSEYACSCWCTDTSFPVLSWISSPYLAECAFLPRRGSSRWGSTFCNVSQEISSGFPDRSCSAAPLFHSWEDQDRP